MRPLFCAHRWDSSFSLLASAFLVPKLLFGNAGLEALLRGPCKDSKQSFSTCVPKQEFGNEDGGRRVRTAKMNWLPPLSLAYSPLPRCSAAVAPYTEATLNPAARWSCT